MTADTSELRQRYQSVADEALIEAYIQGPDAFTPDAWAVISAEMTARGLSHSIQPPSPAPRTGAAHVISYRETHRLMVSRLLLPSGEKIFIKVVVAPVPFVGVWQLGSMNPVNILVDWVMSKFTGHRTAGLQQLWGLGADAIGDTETWNSIVQLMFNPRSEPRTLLNAVTSCLQLCTSISQVESLLSERQDAAARTLAAQA